MIVAPAPAIAAGGDVHATAERRWRLLLCGYIAAHALAWVLVPWLVNAEHPGDNYEQLEWAKHVAWGFDKHPPLPTMILWLAERLLPARMWVTYLLGGSEVATMLLLTWWISRRLLDEKRAILAVLLASCITYYTSRLHFYNHNTGLLVAYALSVACVYAAVRSRRRHWYALLGVVWALGLLCKYQMVIGIACNAACVLWLERPRWAAAIGRLALAAVVCAVLLMPHLQWLSAHDYPSFKYAATYVAAHLPWWQRPADVVGFLLDQLMRVAPLMIWLGLFAWLRGRQPSGRAQPDNDLQVNRCGFAPAFIAIHAWGPLLLMCALSLALGVDLEMHWGTAFLWMLAPWFLCTPAGLALARLPLAAVFAACAGLQGIMLVVYR